MPNIIGVEDFKGQVDSVLNGLDAGGQPIYVVEDQELKAVLISPQDWAGLMDGIQVLQQMLGDAAAEGEGQGIGVDPFDQGGPGPSGLILPRAGAPRPPEPRPRARRPRK